VFGCTAHVRTSGTHLKKLDDRSKPMVYLGVDEGCKAPMLLDVTGNKVVVSRDIICEESIPWSWSAVSGEDVTVDFVVVDEVEPVIYDVGSGNSEGHAQQTQSVSGGASGGNIVESAG